MEMRKAAVALLLTAALAASGCGVLVGAGIGAAGAYAGYTYESGKFDTTYHASYDRVYDTTLASLKGMDIPVTKVKKDAAGAEIQATRADGTNVSVDLTKTGPTTTDASIRVGLMGDEAASKTIANNIAKKLGEEQRQPVGRGGEDVQSQDIGDK